MKHTYFFSTLLVWIFWFGFTSNLLGENSKPNLILIMADDLGFSDLGCYGGEIKTPHLDQLANDGVRFTGFKNTARCAPSRASLLTGRFQHAVEIGWMSTDDHQPGYRGQLSEKAPTISEILKLNGYSTGMVGKWHLAHTDKNSSVKRLFPLDRGFDYFYGTWFGAKDYFKPQYMMTQNEHVINKTYPKDYYLTHDLSDSAINYVSSRIDKSDPFFLYLAHYAPHKPIQAPAIHVERILSRYKQGYETLQKKRFDRQKEMGIVSENVKLAKGMSDWSGLEKKKQDAWVYKMATYAAMIEIMDQGLGELFDLLKKKGVYENTIILFLSDNGSTSEGKGDNSYSKLSNTPFQGKKAQTYEGGISSPLLISWPKRLHSLAGSIRPERCHIIDILPTCLKMLNIEFPNHFKGLKATEPDGVSLLSTMLNDQENERPFFWEHQGSRAIASENWKLVADGKHKPWELYDLKNDPTEQKNVASIYPEKVASLKKEWELWGEKNHVLPLISPQERKQRSLVKKK